MSEGCMVAGRKDLLRKVLVLALLFGGGNGGGSWVAAMVEGEDQVCKRMSRCR